MEYVRKTTTNTLHIRREQTGVMLCGVLIPHGQVFPESTVRALGKMAKTCKRCEDLRPKS